MIFHATLQQLRLFASVARHKSFTRAAEAVHLTQPAVSIQVKRLEDKVGMPLIEQMGKQLHLTVAGEEVYTACQDVLERLANLETALDDMRGEVAGRLSVTVVSSANYFLPHLLGNFMRRYPNVDPKLQFTNREQLLERINANEDDLYIMGETPEELSVVRYPFLENVLVVVARPDHPLAKKKKIDLQVLTKERFVSRETGSGTRKAVERMFAEQHLKIVPYMELGSSEAIKQAVIGGLGIAVLSSHSLRLELETQKLVVLDAVGFPMRRRWYAVHRKGKRLSRAAQTFLSYLRDEGEDEVADLLTAN